MSYDLCCDHMTTSREYHVAFRNCRKMAVASMSVKERLHSLLAHISDIQRSFASLKTVTVIAVTKKHTVESILEAYQAGQKDFGENYVQELVDKAQHRDLQG